MKTCNECHSENVATGKTSFAIQTEEPKDASSFWDITMIVCKDCGHVQFIKQ
jgi:RNase P subunit RPR2